MTLKFARTGSRMREDVINSKNLSVEAGGLAAVAP
jgi:hypothetical protein